MLAWCYDQPNVYNTHFAEMWQGKWIAVLTIWLGKRRAVGISRHSLLKYRISPQPPEYRQLLWIFSRNMVCFRHPEGQQSACTASERKNWCCPFKSSLQNGVSHDPPSHVTGLFWRAYPTMLRRVVHSNAKQYGHCCGSISILWIDFSLFRPVFSDLANPNAVTEKVLSRTQKISSWHGDASCYAACKCRQVWQQQLVLQLD